MGEAGFTLLELLVSLAITGVAAGLLASALWSGRLALARAEQRATAGEGVAVAQAALRDRIGHLLSDADANGTAPDAVGTAAAFSFVASAPDRDRPAPPERVLVERDRAGRLLLAAVDARAGGGGTRPRVTVLLAGIAAAQFGYYGAPQPQAPVRWWAEWPGSADPPRLVRLRLRFVPGDPRRWPDLVMAPGATVAATCRIGPDGTGCAPA